jgi:hypothetical protein
MKRRLFKVFAALSLLLCVATVVLWVRSYFYAEQAGVEWRTNGYRSQWLFISGCGSIGTIHYTQKRTNEFGENEYVCLPASMQPTLSMREVIWDSLSFSWDHGDTLTFNEAIGDDEVMKHYIRISIPYWFPTALLALAPFYLWRKTRTVKMTGAFPVERKEIIDSAMNAKRPKGL